DARRGGRMVAVRVSDEDMRHRLASHRIELRRDMSIVERAGIDERDFVLADDVAHRALEGEGAWIVGKEPPHAGRDLLDLTGRKVEALVEGDVVGHQKRLSA